MRILMPATALASEKMLRGSRAESPYLAFLLNSRSSRSLHLLFILLLVFIFSQCRI
jgi:hypothetical protein